MGGGVAFGPKKIFEKQKKKKRTTRERSNKERMDKFGFVGGSYSFTWSSLVERKRGRGGWVLWCPTSKAKFGATLYKEFPCVKLHFCHKTLLSKPSARYLLTCYLKHQTCWRRIQRKMLCIVLLFPPSASNRVFLSKMTFWIFLFLLYCFSFCFFGKYCIVFPHCNYKTYSSKFWPFLWG